MRRTLLSPRVTYQETKPKNTNNRKLQRYMTRPRCNLNMLSMLMSHIPLPPLVIGNIKKCLSFTTQGNHLPPNVDAIFTVYTITHFHLWLRHTELLLSHRLQYDWMLFLACFFWLSTFWPHPLALPSIFDDDKNNCFRSFHHDFIRIISFSVTVSYKFAKRPCSIPYQSYCFDEWIPNFGFLVVSLMNFACTMQMIEIGRMYDDQSHCRIFIIRSA